MTIRIHGLYALVLLAVWPLSVLAATASHVALPGGDELWLTIPTDWSEKFDSPQGNTPPGVWLTPRQGPSFNVLITPLSGTAVGAAMTDDTRLHSIVASVARKALSHSVEMAIPVQMDQGTPWYSGRTGSTFCLWTSLGTKPGKFTVCTSQKETSCFFGMRTRHRAESIGALLPVTYAKGRTALMRNGLHPRRCHGSSR